MRFCLFVILTHLKGKASVPLTPGAVASVTVLKAKELLINWPDWPFEPQGPELPAESVANPVYFSQQSWSSRYGLAARGFPAAVVGSILPPDVGFFTKMIPVPASKRGRVRALAEVFKAPPLVSCM